MLLPNNSETFKNIVIEKIKTYCDTKIWPFEYDQFLAWLDNFDCKIEEYLALQILNSLIVRSNDMAKASYARLLHGPIRQYLIEHTSINVGTIQKWKADLDSGKLNDSLRMAPVSFEADDGASAGVIYRMLSGELHTNRYSLATAKKTPEVIILIDDFIGSGKQFIEYAEQFKLAEKLENTHILYCPLIGFEIGISKIQAEYPKLKILPAEYIYESNGLFFGTNDEPFNNDNQNTIADVKAFLMGMKKKYAPKMPNWFGFEEAGLPLVFEWGCPNQAPSLLYMRHSKTSDEWQRLFSRRS